LWNGWPATNAHESCSLLLVRVRSSSNKRSHIMDMLGTFIGVMLILLVGGLVVYKKFA
jgi:hypothetical protein